MNYRIYGNNRAKGMELIKTTYSEEEMYNTIDNIDSEIYNVVLVVRHNLNYDEPYIVRSLNRELKRERKKIKWVLKYLLKH